MTRFLGFAFLIICVLICSCAEESSILDDVLLTDADKGTLYINTDNFPSAYSRYPAGDFIVDIPEEILFRTTYNTTLFHGDRIYYSYIKYDIPNNNLTTNGGGIVFCDRNGKYISHREITFSRGNGRFPLRWRPEELLGVYQNNLILSVSFFRDLFSPYDGVEGASMTGILNLDTFEFTRIDGYGSYTVFDRGSVWGSFVIGDILYMRRSPGSVGQKYWDQSRKDRLYAYSLVLMEYTPEHDITINHGYRFDWQIAGEPPTEAGAFSIPIGDTRNDLAAQLAYASFDRIVYDGIGGLWVNVIHDFIINEDLENCPFQFQKDGRNSTVENYLAKFDMQGNFTGEIVAINSTCEEFQTYRRVSPMFPQDGDGELLYFPAWDPNKDRDTWFWKPYKYICYKRNYSESEK